MKITFCEWVEDERGRDTNPPKDTRLDLEPIEFADALARLHELAAVYWDRDGCVMPAIDVEVIHVVQWRWHPRATRRHHDGTTRGDVGCVTWPPRAGAVLMSGYVLGVDLIWLPRERF